MPNIKLQFEEYLIRWLEELDSEADLKDRKAFQKLKESMKYSLQNGGKRFRPLLVLQTVKSLKGSIEEALPYALAVEMIHTYSLIHDDLPLMDDDKERRGQPTNHIIFGEAVALLAGDALLTEAFCHIANSYKEKSDLLAQLLLTLGQAAGFAGMIAGQALDMDPQMINRKEDLNCIHRLKTGALIQASVVGGAWIAGANKKVMNGFKDYGLNLGLAFQIADDLEDHKDLDSKNYVKLLGKKATHDLLKKVSKNACDSLQEIGGSFFELYQLVEFNLNRVSSESLLKDND
ncbi:MAG: polyprenyl synthetase family protein [Bdellovibrionales bacterium]|nr:polyprenyl synthetase family protein [Bdellovibrionales bacterium]